jgi:hypothetical protein
MLLQSLSVLIVAVFGIQILNAQQISVEKVRDMFFDISKSKDGALKLYQSLENINLDNTFVLLAYRGASSAAAAGSVSGVQNKLEYFNRGKGELEKAVGLKPLDAEIRFLRLATQVKAPVFLGYHSDVKSDKAIILKTLGSVPANHPNAYLYHRICSFLLVHTQLESSEKATINQLLVKFAPTQK